MQRSRFVRMLVVLGAAVVALTTPALALAHGSAHARESQATTDARIALQGTDRAVPGAEMEIAQPDHQHPIVVAAVRSATWCCIVAPEAIVPALELAAGHDARSAVPAARSLPPPASRHGPLSASRAPPVA